MSMHGHLYANQHPSDNNIPMVYDVHSITFLQASGILADTFHSYQFRTGFRKLHLTRSVETHCHAGLALSSLQHSTSSSVRLMEGLLFTALSERLTLGVLWLRKGFLKQQASDIHPHRLSK
jgi:hypothetical protein